MGNIQKFQKNDIINDIDLAGKIWTCILFEVRYHSFDIIEPVTFYYVKFYQQNFQITY